METIQIGISDEFAALLAQEFATQNQEEIRHNFRRVIRRLDRLLGNDAEEAADIAALTAKVESGKTLDESIKALVESIADEMVDDPGKVLALAAKLKEQSEALAAAVQANTTS